MNPRLELRTSDWADVSPSNRTLALTHCQDHTGAAQGPSRSPVLDPIGHLCRDMKMAVHRWSPPNLMELERIYRVERQKIPNPDAKLVTSCSRRLKAVISAKDA